MNMQERSEQAGAQNQERLTVDFIKRHILQIDQRLDTGYTREQVDALAVACENVTSLLQQTIAMYVDRGVILNDAGWDVVATAWRTLAPFRGKE